MAEAAGGREQPAAGRAPPDAACRAEEEPELDAPAVAGGRRRERRSGVSAAGTAERFPGSSLGPVAAPDPDVCLLEAAKATPRRSSIIKEEANGLTTELEQEREFAMRSLKLADKMLGDKTREMARDHRT